MKYLSIFWGAIITLMSLWSSRTQAKDLFVIDIGYQTSDVSLAQQIAVLSCQGLMNRNEGKNVFMSRPVITITSLNKKKPCSHLQQ